jgi:ADP-heptose:LPS heptosyltransferase
VAKFLFIRFSSLAEVMLATPLLRCLKQQRPDSEIHFLTREEYGSIFLQNPYVSKTHVLAHSVELMLHELSDEDYSYIIDLQENGFSAMVRRKLGKPFFRARQDRFRESLYVQFKWNLLRGDHLVDRFFYALRFFDIRNDDLGLDYFIPPSAETKKEDIPASHHAGYIGMALGAEYKTRQYPVEKLKLFCEKLDHPLILLGEDADRNRASLITASDPVKIYNACGKFSLHETADLILKSKMLVSNDNGYMQIAAAFKRPVISLWGSTVPSFGTTPYYGPAYLRLSAESVFDQLEVHDLRCRPCSVSGHGVCPRSHFKCMEQLEVDWILAAIKKRL